MNACEGTPVNRMIIAVVAAALVAGTFGLATLQPAAAQPGGPSVCLSLPPGEHTFAAPAQDREGEVSFTVTVGEGGVVVGFTEPGGQSIPPVAMLELFTGEDAYPLPEGISFVECDDAAGDTMEVSAAADVCINLPAGVHEANVNVSGQSQTIVLDVGQGGIVRGVSLLGQTYTAAEGLALMEQFGVSLPPGISLIDCPEPTLYANTGTGGLADTSDSTGLWSAIATVGVLVAVATAVVVRRRRAEVRIRD